MGCRPSLAHNDQKQTHGPHRYHIPYPHIKGTTLITQKGHCHLPHSLVSYGNLRNLAKPLAILIVQVVLWINNCKNKFLLDVAAHSNTTQWPSMRSNRHGFKVWIHVCKNMLNILTIPPFLRRKYDFKIYIHWNKKKIDTLQQQEKNLKINLLCYITPRLYDPLMTSVVKLWDWDKATI